MWNDRLQGSFERLNNIFTHWSMIFNQNFEVTLWTSFTWTLFLHTKKISNCNFPQTYIVSKRKSKLFFLVIKSKNKQFLKFCEMLSGIFFVFILNHKIYYVACDTLTSLWTCKLHSYLFHHLFLGIAFFFLSLVFWVRFDISFCFLYQNNKNKIEVNA